MKDTKRAYRRHKKQVKFLNRLHKQVTPHYSYAGSGRCKTKSEIFKEALAGMSHTKLRSMSTVCSCSMCAYLKYDRADYNKSTQRELDQAF